MIHSVRKGFVASDSRSLETDLDLVNQGVIAMNVVGGLFARGYISATALTRCKKSGLTSAF